MNGRRSGYPGNRRYPYGNGYYGGGVYLGAGFLGYPYYGYGDDSSNGAPSSADQSQAAGPYQDGYAQGAPQQDPGYPPAGPPARAEYDPQAASSAQAQAAEVPEQPEITLVFKDGRPSQQVENYAVTQSTLYVFEGTRRREIPLEQIDIPQTEKTNRDAGLDFSVPAGAE